MNFLPELAGWTVDNNRTVPTNHNHSRHSLLLVSLFYALLTWAHVQYRQDNMYRPYATVTQSTITRTLHDNKSHCVFPVAGERSLTHIFPLCYLIHDWASVLYAVMPIVPGTFMPWGRTGTAIIFRDQAGLARVRMAARYGKKGYFWRAGTTFKLIKHGGPVQLLWFGLCPEGRNFLTCTVLYSIQHG